MSHVNIPIEVIPSAVKAVSARLNEAFGSKLKCLQIRQCSGGKAGPIVSDNGNLVLDAQFDDSLFDDAEKLEGDILSVSGVLGTGIFLMKSCKIFSLEDNQVKTYNW